MQVSYQPRLWTALISDLSFAPVDLVLLSLGVELIFYLPFFLDHFYNPQPVASLSLLSELLFKAIWQSLNEMQPLKTIV